MVDGGGLIRRRVRKVDSDDGAVPTKKTRGVDCAVGVLDSTTRLTIERLMLYELHGWTLILLKWAKQLSRLVGLMFLCIGYIMIIGGSWQGRYKCIAREEMIFDTVAKALANRFRGVLNENIAFTFSSDLV
ncbi:hypothetical protein ACOSQ2_014660 [Xanthoceras sorbifolium]